MSAPEMSAKRKISNAFFIGFNCYFYSNKGAGGLEGSIEEKRLYGNDSALRSAINTLPFDMTTPHIRKIKDIEIPLLADMPPREWKIDLPRIFQLHYHEPYFHALTALVDGEMAGVGNVMINGDVGWLGHIIVREVYRNRGLGHALTAALADYCHARNCRSIQLVATELGQPVYAKLGFQTAEQYLFLCPGSVRELPDASCVVALEKGDWDAVWTLDREATGEDRRLLLSKFADTGFVWRENGRIEGFYLPALGDGLIVARNPAAGTGLLQFKHGGKPELPAVLPEANETGVAWLQSNGFQLARTAPRMFLKADVTRRPELIYSRISGYLG